MQLTVSLPSQPLSLNARITFGYSLPFVMLTLVTVCDVWKGMFDTDTSYRFTLAAIAVVALGCTGTVQIQSPFGHILTVVCQLRHCFSKL